MNYPIYRIAKVIDNSDPDQTGKVQVRILPELNGVADDTQLPWVSPESQSKTGNSAGVGIHNVPDVDSHITVRINDKYWTDIDYLFEAPRLPDAHPYTSFSEDFDIDELSTTPEYPQPRFEKTIDGSIFFHDTSQGIMGIQHPTGMYVAIDEMGKVFLKFVEQLKMKSDDESISIDLNVADGKAEIKADGGEVTIVANDFTFDGTTFTVAGGSDSAVLFTPLEEIIKELLSHMHTAPSGPTTPAEKSDKTPLTALTANLQEMKSQAVTLD